jgi:radical SAM protein with 4Fe4S-binding SPASM domain
MCLRGAREVGFMDFQFYKEIIDDLSTCFKGVKLSLFFGGESSLHRKFRDMLEYAMSKRCFRDVSFTTNGTLFDDDLVDAVLRMNIDVNFSLEGIGAVNDNIRVGAKFDMVANNIFQLVQKRRNEKPRITVNLTKSTQSNDDIAAFIDYFTKAVDYVNISPCADNKFRIIDKGFFDNEIVHNNFCKMPFYFLAILWNGDVVPCCHDINGQLVVGNVKNESLEKIWAGQKLKAQRYSCLTSEFAENSLCNSCND